MSSFMIYAPQMLLGWSIQEEWVGRGIHFTLEKREIHTEFWCGKPERDCVDL